MSRRDDLQLGLRTARALRAAGVLRAMPPKRIVRAVRDAKALQATPAASIAIGAATDPDGVAIIDELGRLTWQQLDRRVRSVAHALQQGFGAGPERPVAVMCRNHRGVIEALGGAARAGADVLALNTEFAAPQIAAALKGRDAAAVICDEEFVARLQESGDDTPRIVAWAGGDGECPSLQSLACANLDLGNTPGHRSRITILTSGTTGVPKGATRDLPVRAMLGPITTLIEYMGLHRGEPILVAPPLFHGFGLAMASIAQAIGAPVVLQRRFEPEATLALIERERVACFVAVPVMLQRILALAPEVRAAHDTSCLRAAMSAGAPLAPHVSTGFMDAFGDIVFNAYGSTETGFGAIAGPADLRAAPGTIGRAPLGSTLQILDEQRRPAPTGQTGHIFVGGDLVFDGYNDGGSKERAAGAMNTGDLGHVDADGRIFVDGREDDMIVSGGENVFPQEVEDALASHPAVVDATVIGVEDAEFGQRLQAYVVAGGEPLTPDELTAYLRTRLERYKLPRGYEFVAEIPRTPTGKVMRRALVG